MGPQLGYFYPELFNEVDAHGAGIDVREVMPPGQPYVLIGRTRDYAWSATAAGNDNRPVPRGALQPGRQSGDASIHEATATRVAAAR